MTLHLADVACMYNYSMYDQVTILCILGGIFHIPTTGVTVENISISKPDV